MLKHKTALKWAQELVDFINDELISDEWDRFTKVSARQRREYFDVMRDVTGKDLRRLAKHRPIGKPRYLVSGLTCALQLDAKGRVTLEPRSVSDLGSLSAFVITELQAKKPVIEIRECGSDDCERLIARKCGRGTGKAGAPKKFCSDDCEADQRERDVKRRTK